MVDQSVRLQMQLSESGFTFSKRMLNFFDALELKTIGDLVSIPLQNFTCYRGFKSRCRQELICFIESENLEGFFDGFRAWRQ